MKRFLIALLLLALPAGGWARMIPTYSGQELFDRADVVVIGKPRSVHDTDEALPPDNWPGFRHGVETEFQISGVLKGDRSLKTVILHTFRFADADQWISSSINGPGIYLFDPKQPDFYLLFLVSDKEGRYEPLSGTLDWAGISVLKLKGDLLRLP